MSCIYTRQHENTSGANPTLMLVYLSLSAESVSYPVVFFSHNKSGNNTFFAKLISRTIMYISNLIH